MSLFRPGKDTVVTVKSKVAPWYVTPDMQVPDMGTHTTKSSLWLTLDYIKSHDAQTKACMGCHIVSKKTGSYKGQTLGGYSHIPTPPPSSIPIGDTWVIFAIGLLFMAVSMRILKHA